MKTKGHQYTKTLDSGYPRTDRLACMHACAWHAHQHPRAHAYTHSERERERVKALNFEHVLSPKIAGTRKVKLNSVAYGGMWVKLIRNEGHS